MRKRRKRTLVCFAVTTLLMLCMLCYLSNYLQVASFMDAHSKAAVLLESIRRLDGAKPPHTSTTQVDNCEVLHVAMVCAGYESSFRVVTLLKSILYHRKHALAIHVLVDNVARYILSTLVATWQLPAVEVSFYDSAAFVQQVAWIPNRHYSKEFGLLKLTLTEVLPLSVDKVLVVDTDVLFVDDLAHLWLHWQAMHSAQAVGMAENLSPWYLSNTSFNTRPWPALERGFNTGVMLMDLGKLRRMQWSVLWRQVATHHLHALGATQLADQDIINAVISEQPAMVYKLPCEWNLQMGYQSRQHLCAAPISELKVVHWNSPEKTRTKNPYAVFFRRHFQTLTRMDGNLLRTALLHCPVDINSSELRAVYEYEDDEDGCGELRHARNTTYRTQLFIRRYEHTVDSVDVTLTTQLSMDRFVLFETLLASWSGPVSAAIYLSDSELAQLMHYLADNELFRSRANIAIHAVFKQGVHFPINYLRNVALNATRSPFVFLTDVDLTPMPGLYHVLRQRLSWNATQGKAFVIPAFEARGYRSSVVPASKAQLLSLVDSGRIQIFRQDVWPRGHSATDYDRWRTTTTEYSVAWRTDYEPYVVLARRETPFYDTRFVGFGWNKVSHVMSLDAAGFDFIVLPNAFMVHQPHSASFEIAKYRSSSVYRRCMKALKGEFVRDVLKAHANRTLA